jgi:hypothetical protein
MSRGLGRIERYILSEVEMAADPDMGPGTVLLNSAGLAQGWKDVEVAEAQRKAVTRAMHSFVRKHPRYALAGGKGRGRLFLYEPGDPLSAKWLQMHLDPKRRRGKRITIRAANAALEAAPEAPATPGRPPLSYFQSLLEPKGSE